MTVRNSPFIYFGVVPSLYLLIFFFATVTRAEDVIVGELDGTHKLTADDIKKGFKKSTTNYITACDTFSNYSDKFVLIVEMGEFKDYLIPENGVTLCDLLTSSASARKYRYAPRDPRDPKWSGFSKTIDPSSYDGALGGSAVGYVSDGRRTLSFWGDSGDDESHTGGCCALLPGQAPRWYRPYRLKLYPMTNSWYMSWGAVPVLAVVDAPVAIDVHIWDVRGKYYDNVVKLRIKTNGVETTQNTTMERALVFGPAPKDGTKTYSIEVELVEGPDVVNTKTLTVSIPVEGKLPLDVTPSSEKPISAMLHFGDMGSVIGPVEKNVALEEDWFATTVEGGSAYLRPVHGQYNTAAGGSLDPFTYRWTNATSDERGFFVANVPCRSLQFYAFAIYSAALQRITLYYTADTAAVVYVGEKRFEAQNYNNGNIWVVFVDVTKGYHQVLVKLYSDDTSSKDPQKCSTISKFSVYLLGTAVGYAPAVMPYIPEGAYELWSNEYLTALLYLGERDKYLYGGLNEDIINVQTARPKRHETFGDNTWRVQIFMDGRIPVSAVNLPADKEAAIIYTAFAIFNQYPTSVPLKWTFNAGGQTDLYIDGKREWGVSNNLGKVQARLLRYISSGWHQIIVRAAATRGQSWILSYAISFDGYRLAGDISLGSNLPYGVVPIKLDAPIPSLLSLQDEWTRRGAIPFDPSNTTATANSFSDFPISSTFNPAPLSTQQINVLGKEWKFRWNTATSTDGIWGGNAYAGNFNEYWALSLYTTENIETNAHIYVHGGFALWVDGVLKDSDSVEASKEHVTKLSLSKGWHQVIVKLKAKDSFHLIDTKDGTTNWTKAHSVCSSNGHMELCSQDDLCPFGVPRPGSIPVGSASSFAPVSDHPNEWVQVFAEGGDNTSLCQSWRDAHGGSAPPWGEEDKNVAERRYVPCCAEYPRSTMWISIEPPASGELGYTYEIPITVEAPVIVIKNAAALTQIVTITTETPGARIEYATRFTRFNPYTAPLKITENVNIVARALNNGRVSAMSFLYVAVPKTQTFDRMECVTNATCPLVIIGVDPGWDIAILTTNIHGSKAAAYKSKAYAKQQQVSAKFSGVLSVGDDNDVIVPPLEGGTFHVFLYPAGQDSGSVADKLLTYTGVTIGPHKVVGTQQTLFNIQGGVMVGDAVFLPHKPGSPSIKCDVKTCLGELKSNIDRIALITSNNNAHINQDFSGFSGELSCMCMCLSCSKANSSQAGRQVVISDDKVIGQAISIRVSPPPTPTQEIVDEVRPTVVFDNTTLQLHGRFDPTVTYVVHFTPIPNASMYSITPSCSVVHVLFDSIACKMVVHAGTMGDWNIALIHGQTNVPFAPDAVRIIRMHPPTPTITSVSGKCARSSASCVNGAIITFHGTNFNPNDVAFNEVKIIVPSGMEPIRCNVTKVMETELSCKLILSSDPIAGIYRVDIRVLSSDKQWSGENIVGSLALGGRVETPGWVNREVSFETDSDAHKTKLVVVAVAFVFVLLFMILGGAAYLWVLDRQYKYRGELSTEDPLSFPARLAYYEHEADQELSLMKENKGVDKVGRRDSDVGPSRLREL